MVVRRVAKQEPWHMRAAREVGKIDKRLSGANYTTALIPRQDARVTFEGRNLARLIFRDDGNRSHVFTMQGSPDRVEFKGSLDNFLLFRNWFNVTHDILRRHVPKK